MSDHVLTEPGEVLVYAFQAYDMRTGDHETALFKAPLPWIERTGGKALQGTAEAVPREALDAQGRYRRVATGWGALD